MRVPEQALRVSGGWSLDYNVSMKKYVQVLVAAMKGGVVLLSSETDGVASPVGLELLPGEAAVKGAVRALEYGLGLEVRTDDLEFLDSFQGAGGVTAVYILAGVDVERLHAYGESNTLQIIQRSDDFSQFGLSDADRKIVIQYFKSHKKA
jgi:hypothetical protein